MDEILHSPKMRSSTPVIPIFSVEGTKSQQKQSAYIRFFAAVQAASVLLRRQGSRVYHRIVSSLADRPVLDPLPFLAITAAIGVASVVGTVYTPAYAVTVDGVKLGTVNEPVVFDRIVDRVESRASTILGYDYVINSDIDYQLALVRKDEVSSISGFETYLFNKVGEVMKSY
ncbi:MAG: M23 family peptidase, partial [Clostridia bacterium]|nr:M23 family peptidase [Clostridia bacterium]